MTCTVRILPGRNLWFMARTNRDAPNRADAQQTGGAVLHRWLGDASPLGTRSIFEVVPSPVDAADPLDARFVIGAARPVVVHAGSPRAGLPNLPALPPGAVLLGAASQCDPLSFVAGPFWSVSAVFDWRGPAVEIPWPVRSVSALGFASAAPSTNADWLLVAAAHLPGPMAPDTSLGSEIATSAGDAATSAKNAIVKPLKAIFWGGVVAASLFLLLQRKK